MGKDLQGGCNNNSEDTTTPFAKEVCEDCRNAELCRLVAYWDLNRDLYKLLSFE